MLCSVSAFVTASEKCLLNAGQKVSRYSEVKSSVIREQDAKGPQGHIYNILDELFQKLMNSSLSLTELSAHHDRCQRAWLL